LQKLGTEHNYTDVLIESLEKKVSVITKIIDINKDLKMTLEESKFDVDKFNDYIDAKEKLILELNKLDDGFVAVYERVAEILKAGNGEYKDQILRLKTLIKEVTDKTATLETGEKRLNDTFNKVSRNIRKEIGDSRKTNKILSGYRTNMSGLNVVEPQFVDKKK